MLPHSKGLHAWLVVLLLGTFALRFPLSVRNSYELKSSLDGIQPTHFSVDKALLNKPTNQLTSMGILLTYLLENCKNRDLGYFHWMVPSSCSSTQLMILHH
jgi:hypothetical protein